MRRIESVFFLFFGSFLYKIILVNLLLFKEIQFSSLLVEMCFVLFLMTIIEAVAPKMKIAFYIILSIVLSILYISVLVYHEYYGAILNFTALSQAGQVSEIRDSIIHLLSPEYLLFFVDLPLLLVTNRINYTAFRLDVKHLLMFGICLVSIITINLFSQLDVLNEKKVAQNIGILNYNIYSMLPKNESQKNKTDITQELIHEIKGINEKENKDFFGVAANKNVIVVQLEAFQNFPIGKMIGNSVLTPNLNKLIQESIYFSNVYQQIGRGNTADAEFILNTSLYPKGDVAMSQEYGDKDIPSLPKILKEYQYTSITMHTNEVEFWNRDQMYQALGFDEVYDKTYFGQEDVIAFGASDEVLYDKSLRILQDLSHQGKKFYVNLIAMSSHHPYKLPKQKPKLELPTEFHKSSVGDYLQAVYYADFALGKLIDELKSEGLWEETLLIIYGDHFGLQPKSSKDKELMEGILGREYHEKLDAFNIPLIIHIPGFTNGLEIPKLGGQIDLMPTIATLLGIPLDNHIHFGQDLLNTQSNLLGNRFYLPTGSFINDDILFIPGEGFEDGKAYNLNTKQPLSEFQQYHPDYDRTQKLLKLADDYIDSLPKRRE